MSTIEEAIAVNRTNWEDRAMAHAQDKTGFYHIAEFKAGRDTLTPIEKAEIGNVAGLRVLHLQCHIGLDTLSLARRGAHVTGLDFSANAIAFARKLAAEIGVSATFVEADVHDVRSAIAGEFDMVYATWGVLCWIPDARRWMRAAASMLAPNGRLYLANDHPLRERVREISMPDGSRRLVIEDGWQAEPGQTFQDQPYSYTGDTIEHGRCFEWNHSLSEIVTGAADAGLRLLFLHEHDRIPWNPLACMEPAGDDLYRLPANVPGVPLAFSLMATR